MPETAIHKNCNLLLAKGEIRSPRDRLVPSPAFYPSLSQQLRQPDLCLLVPPAPNSGHDLGSFGFGPDVGHRISYFS